MIEFNLIKTFGAPSAGKKERSARESATRFRLESAQRLEDGVFLGITGPSGSGKTTLLRCLAGLETPDSGRIEVDGEIWYDTTKKLSLPPQKRSVGMVFQDYALFPHLSVLGNLLYANPDRESALAMLELVELSDRAEYLPAELSGGQKQRTALARALMRNPKLLLLDEPLSAVDEDLREELGDQIRRIQKSIACNAVLVSHNRNEVARLCDTSIDLAYRNRPVSPVS